MKNKFLYILTSLAVVIAAMSSCDDREGRLVNDNDAAPTPIDPAWVKTIEGTHGGAYVVFSELPQESNFLYVEASYVVDDGATITKTMSVYSDTLFINGLGKRKDEFGQYAYDVALRSVSRGGAKSKPTVITVNPLEPNISLVAATVQIKNSFSSMIVSAVNELKENVDICVILATDPDYKNTVTRVSSYADSSIYYTIPNLEEREYWLATYTKDAYNNYSDTTYILNPIVPLTDGYLEAGWGEEDVYSFTTLEDFRLYGNRWDADSLLPRPAYRSTYTKDSMKNASTSYAGTKITNFWDGVTSADDASNLFLTGARTFNRITGHWAYPYSYFIDLGRTVELSRMIIWQATYTPGSNDPIPSIKYYAGYNTKTFELWGRPELPTDVEDLDKPGSDRLTGWFLVGRYTIVTPSSTTLQEAEAKAGHLFQIVDGDEPEFSKPLRYLRFKGVEAFGYNAEDDALNPGSPYIGAMSELALFGRNSNQ